MGEIIYKEESYQIAGACFEVYRQMGCGFLETVYQECLELELLARGIPFVAQPVLQLNYKGQALKSTYQPDLICFGKIVLELKAVEQLADVHKSQVMNYLNATGFALGLLVNFGHYPGVEIERLAHTVKRATNSPS